VVTVEGGEEHANNFRHEPRAVHSHVDVVLAWHTTNHHQGYG
jgi:hypothetical protein